MLYPSDETTGALSFQSKWTWLFDSSAKKGCGPTRSSALKPGYKSMPI